jgi:hypothetical protein
MSRPHSLCRQKIIAIDAWFAAKGRNKNPPAKAIAHSMGVSIRTIWNVARRKYGYEGIPYDLVKEVTM